MNLAPIAVFLYKRPDAAREMLRSLLANPEVATSPVYAFCDGPKSADEREVVAATRAVLRSAGVPNLTVIERDRNVGLAASIIEGVTRLCQEHGRAIVLEDDLILSPTFLAYMNAALDRYESADRVFHVSGYMYDVPLDTRADVVFLPFISSWGWATWSRAWRHFDPAARAYAELRASRSKQVQFDLGARYSFYEMLKAWREGRNDSWAIRWYLSVFSNEGLSVFPARSLVENRGFGKAATHCTGDTPRHVRTTATPFLPRAWPDPVLDRGVLERVSRFMAQDSGPLRGVRTTLRRLVSRIMC